MHELISSLNTAHGIDATLEQIIESAIGRLQDGHPIDVDMLAAVHPNYAEQLRELLPMVAMMVHLGEVTTELPPSAISRNGDAVTQQHQQLGDFRILGELGRGGMGVVYEAEQLSLGRRVALKVLPFAAMLDRQQLARFKNEARAAATLDHPNIVAIYSVGCERSVHYYAMQLIEGRSLADIIAHLKPGRAPSAEITASTAALNNNPAAADTVKAALPTVQAMGSAVFLTIPAVESREFYRSVARLGIDAAQALDHAHQNGILHRDIKPANLLVDDTGKLWITDFGLARIEADVGMTMTGDVLGTLRYMSPEQAIASRVLIDHRCDIYSLGATLYELLTLQPVFADTDRAKLLHHIALEEPQRPRKVDERIPNDLETIILKAMAKQREERYQTAEQFADDLRAFLEGRPIRARPPGLIHCAAKWSHRHQTLVTITGIALVLLLLLATISMVFVKRSEYRAVTALRETSGLLYEADMSLAYLAFEKGRSDEAERILAHHQSTEPGSARRGFEWYLLHSVVTKPASFTLAGHEGSVNEIAAFPDGRRIVSVGDDGTLCIWDLESRELTQKLQLGAEPLHSVAVSQDGRFVAAGSTAIYLCDLTKGLKIHEIFRTEHNFEALAFHADGSRLAAGSRYHDVFLLTLTGELVSRIACGSRVQSLEFVSKENLLLFPNRIPEPQADWFGVAQFWRDDLSSVHEQLNGAPGQRSWNITVARSLPDGRHVLVGERCKPYLIDRASGKVVSSAGSSRCRISDLAVPRDVEAAAISYVNGTIEYRQLKSLRGSVAFCDRPRLFQAHQGETHAVRFVTADRLASCGADALIKLWDISDAAERAYDLADSDNSQDVRLSPDGALLLYTGAHSCAIIRSSNGRVMWKIEKTAAPDPLLAWSPTGNRFAVCLSSSHKRRLRIFDRIGKEVSAIEPSGDPRGVAFSPSDPLVAIIGSQQLQLCNTETGEEITQRSDAGNAPAFSHDGKWLAYGGSNDRIYICDVPGLLTRRALEGEIGVRSLAYSPDDQVLAAGHDNGTIRLWNTTTGQLRAEMTGHEGEVKDLAFSPDGRTLLSCDGVIRVWSVEHGRSYGSFYDSANRMSLSADGRRLAVGIRPTAEDEADVRLWDLEQMILDR